MSLIQWRGFDLWFCLWKVPTCHTKNKTKGHTNWYVHYSSGSLNFSMSRKGLLEDVLLLKVYGTLLELEWHSVEFRPPVCILAHLKRLIFANNIHLFLEKSIKCLANSLSHNAKERETHREKSPESVNIVYSGIIGIIEKINISPFCEGPLKAPQRPKGISRMTSELSDGKWQCILLTAIMLI